MRITPSSLQIANGGGSVVVNADGSVAVNPAIGPIAIGSAGYQAATASGVLTIAPIQPTLSDPFRITAANTIFSGDAVRGDQVVMMGHNVAGGGVSANAAHPALWDSYEQYYAQTNTQHYMERHVGVFFDSTKSNNQYRSLSMQYDIDNVQIHAYMQGTDWSYLDMAGTQWLKLSAGSVALSGASVITHGRNNNQFLTQLNAAGSQYIELIRLDSANNVSLDASQNANGLKISSLQLGFYAHAPAAKQTVTGSKGANAALTSLMAALVAMGLVTDTTT